MVLDMTANWLNYLCEVHPQYRAFFGGLQMALCFSHHDLN